MGFEIFSNYSQIKNYYKIWCHRLVCNFLIVCDMLWDFESGLHNHRGRECIILMCFKIRIVLRTRDILLVKQSGKQKYSQGSDSVYKKRC